MIATAAAWISSSFSGSLISRASPVFLLLLAACGDPQPGATSSGAPTNGSASRVVTDRSTLLGAPLIQLTEELRIGAATAPLDQQFSTVTHTTLGSDHNVYMLDRTDHRVRVFDKEGTRLQQFGREGEGPGELQFPELLAASMDSIIVFDNGRFHIFSSEGLPLATRPFVSPRLRNYVDLRIAQRTADAWVIVTGSGFQSTIPAGSPHSDSIHVSRFNPATGELGVSIVSLPGPVTFLLGSAGWLRERFMTATPRVAVSVAGTIYVTTGDEYVIRVLAPDGTPIREIVADVEKIPVTESQFRAELDAEIEGIVARGVAPGSESEALVATLRKDGMVPGHATHRPILGRIIASPDGELLVERLDLDPRPLAAGDPVHWDVINRDGLLTGRFITPVGVFPRVHVGGKIFAVVRDADNLPSIVRYGMR